MHLNEQEFDVLIESLEVWECQLQTESLNASLLESLLGPLRTSEELRANMERKMDEAKKASKARKERSTLLKAKLITMRDSKTADDMKRVER